MRPGKAECLNPLTGWRDAGTTRVAPSRQSGPHQGVLPGRHAELSLRAARVASSSRESTSMKTRGWRCR